MEILKRYAVYLIPNKNTALARLGSAFLGRDSESGLPTGLPLLDGLTPKRLFILTSKARQYGLHLTLKAPFPLGSSRHEKGLLNAARQFAAQRPPLILPRLVLSRIGSFFALVPATDTPEEKHAARQLHRLAHDAVKEFDIFRGYAPWREIRGLTLSQQQNYREWGYPYVLEDFRPHFTIVGRLRCSSESRRLERLLAAYFAPALTEPLTFDSICVCSQRAQNQRSVLTPAQIKHPSNGLFYLQARFPCQGATLPHQTAGALSI